MKWTRSFIKTSRTAPAGSAVDSYALLYRAGFLRPVTTGRFTLLPLGYRVYLKVIDLISKEMDAIGSQRMELPILQPIEVWKVTNRDTAFGDLMSIVDDHYGRRFVMSATGEALMTEIFGSFKPSYKDLPINVYQFMTKFRDELRPRGGLIRAREFLMKDAYNFEADEKSFMKTYKLFWDAYDRIFRAVKLDPIPVIAENGALGGDYSHEFMQIVPEKKEDLDMYENVDEKELSMDVIDASDNDSKYDAILKEYARNPEKTLKNLIYKIDDKAYVCVSIRGDYQIDFTKLKRLLGYSQIRPASKSEIEEMGSFAGYVSPIGLNQDVRIIFDESVKYGKNYWDGANKDRVFRKNVNFSRDIKVEKFEDVREDKIFSPGADKIVMCDRCEYKANVEKAEFVRDSVNMDEEMKKFKIIDQPEWVCTMEDNIEHYKRPKSHYLKNVVYKTKDGKLVIAVLRGDLEAQPAKLANVAGTGELELADDHDLEIIDTRSGWVHSWGHDKGRKDVIYVADISLEVSRNLIGGQKEKTTDAFNVNYGRDFKHERLGDIASAYDGSKCPNCKDGYLHEKKAIELGHIFKYDTYYSVPHKAMFVDKDGKEKPMYMGAYGIGVGRLMATCAEINHDEKGIIWPSIIAPYHVHIVTVGKKEKTIKLSESVYATLEDAGYEVLWDDRNDVSAGVKFNDADLIGIPVRIVVSDKIAELNKIELKARGSDQSDVIDAQLKDYREKIDAMLKKW